jgi:hypothetical protein
MASLWFTMGDGYRGVPNSGTEQLAHPRVDERETGAPFLPRRKIVGAVAPSR